MEESVSENGSVITDYQFEQNTYSDSQFLQDNLQKTDYQEDGSVLVTDGAYCGAENTALAASKNIKLVTTDLTGKDVPDMGNIIKQNVNAPVDVIYNTVETDLIRERGNESVDDIHFCPDELNIISVAKLRYYYYNKYYNKEYVSCVW